MKLNLTYPPGATPLDPDEIAGLLRSDISTQGELNAAEQANIISARVKYLKPGKPEFSDRFIKRLHKDMFGDVWKWAGQYRKTDKNIGVHWTQITVEIHKLCEDANYWAENKVYKTWDEWAVHLHHRLVHIHPFPNGNGRHARLMVDIFLLSLGEKPFTWGARDAGALDKPGEIRTRYLDALRAADNRNFEPLMKFVRS